IQGVFRPLLASVRWGPGLLDRLLRRRLCADRGRLQPLELALPDSTGGDPHRRWNLLRLTEAARTGWFATSVHPHPGGHHHRWPAGNPAGPGPAIRRLAPREPVVAWRVAPAVDRLSNLPRA